jgi:hypothetical protein
LPAGLVRWVSLLVLSTLCGLMIWIEATEEIGGLELLFSAVVLILMGAALTIAALVRTVKKLALRGTLVGLGVVAFTFCIVQFRLPSQSVEKSLQFLDKYRLARYETAANQTLLEIRRANPDLRSVKKLDGEEMNQFLPSDLPSSIRNARLLVFTSSDGLSDFTLIVDTIYCRLNAGSSVAECGSVRTTAPHAISD